MKTLPLCESSQIFKKCFASVDDSQRKGGCFADGDACILSIFCRPQPPTLNVLMQCKSFDNNAQLARIFLKLSKFTKLNRHKLKKMFFVIMFFEMLSDVSKLGI